MKSLFRDFQNDINKIPKISLKYLISQRTEQSNFIKTFVSNRGIRKIKLKNASLKSTHQLRWVDHVITAMHQSCTLLVSTVNLYPSVTNWRLGPFWNLTKMIFLKQLITKKYTFLIRTQYMRTYGFRGPNFRKCF